MYKYNKHYINEMINDTSADVYNWFNKYCMDLLDHTDYRWIESTLNNLDYTELANEAIIDLSLSDDEDTRLLVEDELEKLTSEFINYMKFGKDNSFSRSNSDWLDRYSDNDAYTASLENYKENKMIRRKTNKFESRKLTLEERISRLERALTSNRKSRRFEGARPGTMMVICKQIKNMICDALEHEDELEDDCVAVFPDESGEGMKVTYDDGDEFDNVAEYSVQLLDGNFYVMDDNAELDLGIYEDLDGVVDAIVEDLHQRWLDD